jgi:TldD protein
MEYGILSGVGVRVIDGEQVGYAYADSYDMNELREAARIAAAVAGGKKSGAPKAFQASDARPPFVLQSPLPVTLAEDAKLALCRRVDQAARAVDPRIKQVQVIWADTARRILVANSNGLWADDEHYITRLLSQVWAIDGARREVAIGRAGGQIDADFFEKNPPEAVGQSAAKVAVLKLEARDVKAGPQEVVIGPGWGGVLVHECFGHSLEGDGIRKKTSVRASQLNQKVAADIVNIFDDGTVPNGRGSFRVDDEGTPSQKNHVVDNGVLKGYLWDYLNAKIANFPLTGNGRRNSYRDYPIPRMTNTYIAAGTSTPEEIITSVKSGIFCKDMGGGSVNPADGNFSFAVTEAYQIEDGRIAYPIKNCTLTGNAVDAMLRIVMLGNDLEMESCAGTCGKEGQWKPVGVGQPTVKFSEMTVGGTA